MGGCVCLDVSCVNMRIRHFAKLGDGLGTSMTPW
jgi:hypothetical protein